MTLRQTFKTCLGIKADETVLLLTDTDMKPVSKIVSKALSPLGRELIVMTMSPRRIHGEELPGSVAKAMCSSNVVVGATSKSMTHTQATRNAVKKGVRVASMPGITLDMLRKGGMTADYGEVARDARKLADVLTHGKSIQIETSSGTDFQADISGRKGFADTGLLVNKGDFGNLPGGEGFIAPVEGSSKGRIVFDGPIASSGLDHTPFTVEVEDGKAVWTDYSELERVFKEIKNSRLIGEIGIGVNKKARLIGNILEDEKAFGSAHIAFGNNTNFGGTIKAKVHLDGIIKKPTVLVNDVVILNSHI